MKETMETYILESKDKLLKNVDRREKLTRVLVSKFIKSKATKIGVVASGSSFNAALCALPYMKEMLKLDIEVTSPYTFTNYTKLRADTFYFVISQGGESTNALAALDYIKNSGVEAIALTGNLKSSMKLHASTVIDYGVGVEKVGYVTKGVVSLTLFLDLFALEVKKIRENIKDVDYNNYIKDILVAISSYETVEDKTKKFIELNYSRLTSMHQAYVLGTDVCYGIACEGALKIGETICIPSSAHESEEFLHGPNLQLNPTYTVFILDGNDRTSRRSMEIYEAVKATKAACFYIGVGNNKQEGDQIWINSKVNRLLLPFVYLQIFQWISHVIATDLNKWGKHPMFKEFKEHISYKVKR